MSQANRLKLKKGRDLQRKQKYKHGETKKTGSAKRGYKTLYWNQKTGSWQSKKPAPLIRKVEVKKEKPKTRAQKLEEGMATWNTKKGNEAWGAELPGSKMVKKTETPKTQTETKTGTQTNTQTNTQTEKPKYKQVTQEELDKKLSENKEKPSNKLKAGPKKYGNAPKGYIKVGNKFASLKSVKGKRAALKADRLKILQKKILENKKKNKES